jgi:hypothetical protein
MFTEPDYQSQLDDIAQETECAMTQAQKVESRDSAATEWLTRSDIAAELKISAKQAGRLMEDMPCLLIGTTHRRVSRVDFDAWVERKKEVGNCQTVRKANVRQAATRAAGRRIGGISSSSSGSVIAAAQAMKTRRTQRISSTR